MSYGAALVRRWSRRDVLAVLVVAASVAFVTGSGLVANAASAELAGVAAEFESPASVRHHDSAGAARRATPADGVVLPIATATLPDGATVTVVGVPADAPEFGSERVFALPAPPPGGELRGPVESPRQVTLQGEQATVQFRVTPRAGGDSLPDRWYVASPSTVRELGSTGALGVSPGTGPTPVLGVLAFFLAGSRQVVRSLALATGAAGLLLGVTVFAATRITVRDRLRTIRVVRATGAPPRRVLGVFGARAALQTAVGIAAGYALGVIGPNAAVNVAVFLGRPTSLSLRVTRPVVAVLAPSYVALLAVGTAGGLLAALPAVRRPPAELVDGATVRGAAAGLTDRLPALSRTRLLDWRAVVPTATTLGVFLVVVVLVASTAGVVAGVAGSGGTTITEPGATHPFSSRLPASYATALRVEGTPASAEILVLGTADGQPYVARGANFSAFAAVTDAELRDGRAPARPGEVVVGVDFARTFDLAVGDSFVVGGSVYPAVDRLRVVGTYAAPEPFDDQAVMPLATARHLTGLPPGKVHLVRTAESVEGPGGDRVLVAGVDAPGEVPAGSEVRVRVTLLNPSEEPRSRTVRARLGGASVERTVDLAPGERQEVTLRLPAGDPRTATLSVAGQRRQVTVVDPTSIDIVGLPAVAPPGSAPRVRVVTAVGDPVGNATVRVGDQVVTTAPDGWVRVPLEEVGERTLVATAGNRNATANVTVRKDAIRRPVVSIQVSPSDPTPATRPTVRVTVSNPWNRSLTVPLTLAGPGGTADRSVTVPPGGDATVTQRLSRRPAGEYEVAVRSRGSTLATTTYRVEGDARLAAALATSGRRAGTGVGQALSVVLGNLELVVATVLGLAAAMTVGGTTAGFASAVHARRRTLGVHRATGATPRQVLALVLGDAARIGVVATGLGLVLAGVAVLALDAAGLLTVYGVRLLATVDPLVVAGAAVAALALALAGATLATLGVLRVAPSSLLAEGDEAPTGGARDG